jgi:UDP:flavonoid glycosyltransferase YjiC (YdhE family)
MRVLFVASPMVGHVLPLVPLATAVREAGHEVLLATAEDGVRAASDAGLPVRDVAPGLRISRVFLGPALRHPRLVRRELAGEGGLDLAGHLFTAVAARMAGALELTEEWRPDLVVQEPLAATGALVAARSGVPLVVADANLFDARQQLVAVTRLLGPMLRRHGLESVPTPAEVLTTVPSSVGGERTGLPMRFVPVGGRGDVPDDLVRDGRPTVVVGRSTVATPGRDRLMPRVVAVAGEADVDVVLARPEPRVVRRPLPPNVRTTGWLPFADVLPRVAGIVHHGGAGTLMTALAAGVPQLVALGTGDRTVNARLVERRGAGLARATAKITAEDLERLATDAGLAAAAREVAEEIAAMPHPRELVEPLVTLAGGPAVRRR